MLRCESIPDQENKKKPKTLILVFVHFCFTKCSINLLLSIFQFCIIKTITLKHHRLITILQSNLYFSINLMLRFVSLSAIPSFPSSRKKSHHTIKTINCFLLFFFYYYLFLLRLQNWKQIIRNNARMKGMLDLCLVALFTIHCLNFT